MIPTRLARWSRLTCGCGTACMREDPAMTVIPMVTRRLLRTKQAEQMLLVRPSDADPTTDPATS
jgi:hypothetical protein